MQGDREVEIEKIRRVRMEKKEKGEIVIVKIRSEKRRQILKKKGKLKKKEI